MRRASASQLNALRFDWLRPPIFPQLRSTMIQPKRSGIAVMR